MTIVKLEKNHVPQIAEIEKCCFSDPRNEESIASDLENRLSLWLVAMEGDRVAGYVGSQTVLGEADMMNIAVHPDFRRKGIGEALVKKLIAELSQTGCHSLTLEVRVSNGPAKSLYEKLGFVMVGRRKNYYFHPREDADILRKEWEF